MTIRPGYRFSQLTSALPSEAALHVGRGLTRASLPSLTSIGCARRPTLTDRQMRTVQALIDRGINEETIAEVVQNMVTGSGTNEGSPTTPSTPETAAVTQHNSPVAPGEPPVYDFKSRESEGPRCRWTRLNSYRTSISNA